jgi:tRNA C32,U32 (ribose-2'-O)-methylase TrmJ
MPYTMDDMYVATINEPACYELEEMPKSLRVKFNEAGEGSFEYLISKSGDIISLRSRVVLQRANFQPEEYEILREFFNMIVSKHKEQIVFKKKK